IRHVDCDRDLVAMEVALESALAIAQRRRDFPLDLHHCCAMVGENPRRDRAGNDPGEIENPHAFEWKGHSYLQASGSSPRPVGKRTARSAKRGSACSAARIATRDSGKRTQRTRAE